MSKIVNRITITLRETEGRVEFKESPSLLELCRSVHILQQILEHNFQPEHIEAAFDVVKRHTENIEEVPRE